MASPWFTTAQAPEVGLSYAHTLPSCFACKLCASLLDLRFERDKDASRARRTSKMLRILFIWGNMPQPFWPMFRCESLLPRPAGRSRPQPSFDPGMYLRDNGSLKSVPPSRHPPNSAQCAWKQRSVGMKVDGGRPRRYATPPVLTAVRKRTLEQGAEMENEKLMSVLSTVVFLRSACLSRDGGRREGTQPDRPVDPGGRRVPSTAAELDRPSAIVRHCHRAETDKGGVETLVRLRGVGGCKRLVRAPDGI